MTIDHVKTLVKQMFDEDWDITRNADTGEPLPIEHVECLVEFAARKAVEDLVNGGLGYKNTDFISSNLTAYPKCAHRPWPACKSDPLPHSIFCAEHQV